MKAIVYALALGAALFTSQNSYADMPPRASVLEEKIMAGEPFFLFDTATLCDTADVYKEFFAASDRDSAAYIVQQKVEGGVCHNYAHVWARLKSVVSVEHAFASDTYCLLKVDVDVTEGDDAHNVTKTFFAEKLVMSRAFLDFCTNSVK